MKTHILKSLPKHYKGSKSGKKMFEVRKDDRGFKVGDHVEIHLFKYGKMSKKHLIFKIKYILRHKDFPSGIKKGYCILGLKITYAFELSEWVNTINV